jgi:hypothetical protein
MSFTWSHPACFDAELQDDFLARRNWTWSLDSKGEKPATWEDVKAGNHLQLYVTWEYHLVHCTYMWKKMHRAVSARRPLDSYIMNPMHTHHCEEMLLDRKVGLNEKNTIIKTKFPSCPI